MYSIFDLHRILFNLYLVLRSDFCNDPTIHVLTTFICVRRPEFITGGNIDYSFVIGFEELQFERFILIEFGLNSFSHVNYFHILPIFVFQNIFLLSKFVSIHWFARSANDFKFLSPFELHRLVVVLNWFEKNPINSNLAAI